MADENEKNKIDLDKILLPKKEVPGHTPQSAQRINAGALLEQEIIAGKEGFPKSAEKPASDSPSAQIKDSDIVGASPQQVSPKSNSPTPAAEESSIRPIETYQGDIERMVQDKNVSVLSIAAAEADRRAEVASQPAQSESTANGFLNNRWVRAAMIVLGVILLVSASGALAYLFTKSTSTVPIAVAPLAPFIAVDDTKTVLLAPDESHDSVMGQIVAAQKNVTLSLGLIERLLPVYASTTPQGSQVRVPISAQVLLTSIAPYIPQDFVRTLHPEYLLGVHVYNDNQAFLILKVDSYEQGYAGLLAWETTMYPDLLPLFAYSPRTHIPEENIATSTASSTARLIQTSFIDRIVENHDARVLQNEYRDVYFLWTFLDSNTVVITTNEATLRQIISSLKTAPVTPIPGS